MEHREQNHRSTERLQNKGQKMKREGEKIQLLKHTLKMEREVKGGRKQ